MYSILHSIPTLHVCIVTEESERDQYFSQKRGLVLFTKAVDITTCIPCAREFVVAFEESTYLLSKENVARL